MSRVSVIVFGCVLLLLAQSASAFIELDPASNLFIDGETGSTHIYHGINVVYKEPPYLPCMDCAFDPLYSLNSDDISNLTSFGFNSVRLGVMWQAVEPVSGEYNYTYLDEVEKLINKLGKEGNITTLIDMHQDLFGPQSCGEGFPRWVGEIAITHRSCNESFLAKAAHLAGVCKSISEFGMKENQQGDPLYSECIKHPFSMFYPTAEISSAFQSLYTNYHGLLDRFVAFWNVVSERFATNPFVIGFDLLNEPFVGDLWGNVAEALAAGYSDRTYLQPLYRQLDEQIRQNDQNHLVFYEPTPFPDSLPLFGGIVSPVGFNSTPGSVAGGSSSRDVLSFHIYCCLASPSSCDHDGNPTDDATCDKFNERSMNLRVADQKRLGGGGFLTEFGACTTGEKCVAEIERTTNAADENLVSWQYWQYKYFDDVTTTSGAQEGLYDVSAGGVYEDKAKALCRSYAQVVQGTPLHMQFNANNGTFMLEYRSDAERTEQTDIYIHEQYYYPKGFEVQFNLPENLISYTYNSNHQSDSTNKRTNKLLSL